LLAPRKLKKAGDILHALNLLLNSGFERFHVALTAEGAAHSFELGTVRIFPAADRIDLPTGPWRTRARRIILWKTMFPQGHLYASAFHEPEFQSLPKNLEPGSELRNLLEQAIEKIPAAKLFLIKGGPTQNR
jgi:hypothetical protein